VCVCGVRMGVCICVCALSVCIRARVCEYLPLFTAAADAVYVGHLFSTAAVFKKHRFFLVFRNNQHIYSSVGVNRRENSNVVLDIRWSSNSGRVASALLGRIIRTFGLEKEENASLDKSTSSGQL